MSCGGHWPSYYLYRHLFSGNAILYYFIYQIIGLYTCLLVLYCYSEGVFRFDSGSLKDLAAELDRWRTQLDYRGPIARTWAGRLRRDLEDLANVRGAHTLGAVGVELLPGDGHRRCL